MLMMIVIKWGIYCGKFVNVCYLMVREVEEVKDFGVVG